MATKRIATKEIGPKRGFGGRPRRHTISEKEDLEKTRSLARRSALLALQGYVDQLSATKTIFWQGEAVAEVVDWGTRQSAQSEILDRAGVSRTVTVETNDPFALALAKVVEAVKGQE